MAHIHSTALVDPAAKLGHDVTIGPFVVIEQDVEIGEQCVIAAHAIIKAGTTIGPANQVGEAAVLGGRAQHSKAASMGGRVQIGAQNTIREHVTIHRGLAGDDTTRVGDRNLLMAGCHLGHDVQVESDTIVANHVLLGGHALVQSFAYLSGAVAVHQFCRIGAHAMVGGQSHVTQDVPPYVTVDGRTSRVVGLNQIGLRRRGFTTEQLRELKAAYRMLYRSGLRWEELLNALRAEFPEGPASLLHQFLASTQRGVVQERRASRMATLRITGREDEETPGADIRRAG